jgi:ABC-type glycerol-3-phosphate transport system permease component
MTARRSGWAEPVRHLIIAGLAALTLFPFYFIIVNSLKNTAQFSEDQLGLPTVFQWGNYARAWAVVAGPIVNTAVVVSVSVAGILLLSSLSAYAFAVLEFPFKRLLFLVVFGLLLIPSFLTIIPLYLQIKRFNVGGLRIDNTYFALILPYIAAGQAFSIFVLRTFFAGISKELFEAARMDGAGELRIYRSVVLPLSVPVLTSVAITSFIGLWDDYLLPSLVLQRARQTVAVALVAFQGGAGSGTVTDYSALMAAYAIASLPLFVLFTLASRNFVEGLTTGALKL